MASLRETMPFTAAFIDECRAAFGVEAVNASIRAGMQGQQTFWASESGVEIGTKIPEPTRYVDGNSMVKGDAALPWAERQARK